MGHFVDIDEVAETSFDPLVTHTSNSIGEEPGMDELLTERRRRAEDRAEWRRLNDGMDFESENLYC